MRLPIDIVPNTDPPRFKWTQVVDAPCGKEVVEHEGMLPPALERAVERVIVMAKQLMADNLALQGTVAQLEFLNQKTDKANRPALAPQPILAKKGNR